MAVQESRLVISIDARNAERTAKALNSELQGITDNGAKADNQINAMSGSLKALAGYMGGILTISSAISMADGYTQMAARIRNATSSAEEYELVQERILATANTTFRSLGEAQEVYLSMAGGMKSLGYQTTQTLDLVDSLSFSFTHNATRADQAQSAMDSLSKSMAKGKIDADAWISIVTGADNVIADMAKTTGKTEAEIRKLGAEGKASLEDLIKTLIATRDENERLANNMENSLADGFTKLTNELTVYLGKANEATSATGLMAGALTVLADNLDLVANAALVGGIGYITKAIVTKTIAVQGAIAASVAQKAADAAEAQSSIAVATAKVNEAKAHLANVQATNAETQAKYGAAAANARYKLASDAVTQALIAQTAAQGALNSSVTLGSRVLGLVGGPIGAITIGVSALAAGYMYLQSRTAEANAKLEEQGKIANKTNAELEKLAGNDKVSAVNDLTAAFNSQNEALSKSKEAVDAVLFAIRASSVENERARKITEDARNGVISYTDAIRLLNNEKISVDLYNKLKDQADQYDQNSIKAANTQRALAALKVEVDLAGNAMQNAANKALNKADSMDRDASATRDAAQANREYTQSLSDRLWNQQFVNRLTTKHNKTQEEAQLLLEAYRANQKEDIRGVTAEQKKLISELTREKKVADDLVKSATAGAKARKKAESEATKQRNKDNKEAERLQEEQYQLREQIAYEYADRIGKIEKDLAREIADIQKANFSSPEQTRGFIQNAQNRADLEKQLYIAQLTQQYSEWRATEEQKLDYRVHVNELMIQLDSDMNDDLKKQAMQSLKDQANYELAQIELNKEKRLFAANEIFMSEKDKIAERYRLEREEILKNKQLTEQERQAQIAGTFVREAADTAMQQQSVAQNYLGAIGVDYSMEAEFQKRREAIIAANEWEFITEQEKNERLLQLDREYQAARLSLQLDYGQQITGSFADVFKTIAGEQSNGYKLMFTAQKAFAIASSMIAIKNGIAQAFSLPFPLNLAAAATVAAQTASLVSDIKAVKEGGFKDGGYTGNMGKNQVAGVVHGQEYVLNAEATKRVGRGTLDALNNGGTLESGGGVNVIINVPQGYKAVQTQSENGVTIDIVENMINQSWGNVNRPNSNESRAIQGAFGIAPKR